MGARLPGCPARPVAQLPSSLPRQSGTQVRRGGQVRRGVAEGAGLGATD